jgi:CheY-like chemotaxis protein
VVDTAVTAEPDCDVLVVEDDDDEREMLAALLRKRGWTVETAANGLEALQRPRSARVVVLDLHMPQMSGAGFLVHRQGTRWAHVPAIVVSGWPGGVDEAAAGVVAHLDKPVDVEQLHALITKCTTQGPA